MIQTRFQAKLLKQVSLIVAEMYCDLVQTYCLPRNHHEEHIEIVEWEYLDEAMGYDWDDDREVAILVERHRDHFIEYATIAVTNAIEEQREFLFPDSSVPADWMPAININIIHSGVEIHVIPK